MHVQILGSAADGTLELLEPLPGPRQVLIPLSCTPPIQDEDCAERAEHVGRKVEVPYDGMSIEL